MARQRLDLELVRQGLAESRERARALILAGRVLVDGQPATKAGTLVAEGSRVEVAGGPEYVSRGGQKLAHALDRFGVSVEGLVAADVGASTGGFTDVLLRRGAQKVYAIDVGYGQLDYGLRQDARVVVMERVNARYLQGLPDPIDLATADVSFISLEKILPALRRVLRPDGVVVALVKPQFEAGPAQVGKGGVVRDPAVHAEVLRRVVAAAGEHRLALRGITPSPILGPAGNREFLAYFGPGEPAVDPDEAIREAVGTGRHGDGEMG